jgi:pimeloyl-ACP methyl ester carboxylesterase
MPTYPELFVAPEWRIPRSATLYDPADLPARSTRELVSIAASDGGGSFGLLHEPAQRASTCAFIMHPRTNATRHYLAPALLHAGISVWAQTSRHINNDSDMTHEEVLLDVAAGMRMLRDRGYQKVILIGNSGGGSLFGYYQAQASREPAARHLTTPAGDPTGFEREDMPPGDLYIALAAHQGEGRILMGLLDPAVVDENDPVANDAALDMFDARNGYRPFPEPSRYDAEWVKRYREAQVRRCERLDAIARSRVEAYRGARRVADPNDLSSPIARQALATRYLVIYRTIANPAHLDPTISPNRRPMGTIFVQGNPIRGNYGPGNLARILTPRAWLSTWSGLSSQAELPESIAEVTIPTLIVYADADCDIYPEDQEALLAHSAAADKTLDTVAWAGHYLTPIEGAPEGLAHPRVRGAELILKWLKERL